MDIKVNGRTLSDRPLVLGVQGDNNVEELRFLVPRYTDAGVDLSLGIGYAVFRLPDGTDGHVSLTPEVLDTDENTVSLTLLVGSQMTEQKGSGKLCLKVAGLESAMWSSTICDMFVGGTIALPSPQPYSLFRTMSVGPRLTEDESEPPLTVTERTINIPAELQTIAVAQDENSETVKIVVPRYFDGQDLSVHDFILHTEMGSNGTDDILFNNQNGQMKAVEDSTVTLTWVLRPPQTSYEGKLNIQLLVQGDEFKWHSLIGELTIAKHITGDPVVPATPSMYEQWLAEVKEQADYVRSQAANIQTVVDEMDAIKDAPAAAKRAEAAAAEAEKSAAESKGFRKFYSAVAPDANGNLDPSRPMTVGPAASVEIESAGDRIQSVTALGFTQQAGTGDPSPSNVRALTNGGLRYTKVVLNGEENVTYADRTPGQLGSFYLITGDGINTPVTSFNTPENTTVCNKAETRNPYIAVGDFCIAGNQAGNSQIRLGFSAGKDPGSPSAVKALLKAAYDSGDPYIVWVPQTTEGSLYAPIILTSGEYRATCLPLTAPLCEGDSVVSWARSGCDQQVVLGTTTKFALSGANIFYCGLTYSVIAYSKQYSNAYPWSQIVGANGNRFNVAETTLYVVDTNFSTAEEFNAHITALEAAGTPIVVWYRSANYTEAADIPVSLETHAQVVKQLNGTEAWELRTDFLPNLFIAPAVPGIASNNALSFCDTYKIVVTQWDKVGLNQVMVIKTENYIGFRDDRYSTAEAAKQGLSESPVTIVYELATPITYAHEAVALEAATGDQLTYTVTGQAGGQVSVTLKPFQDGGHAKTADNATQFDGHAWSEVPGQAPVQSVNSKTGAVTLAAEDVGAVPLNHTAVLADGITLKDGSPVNTPADIDQYTVLRIYSNYGAAVCSVPIKGGQTGFLPFVNGTSALNINIVVVNISRTETQLTLKTNAALRLATTGITAPGTALSVYRIEGLV